MELRSHVDARAAVAAAAAAAVAAAKDGGEPYW
jgi:hypothetical protein